MAAGTSGDESGGETTNVSPETCTSDTGSVSFWGWSSSISCPVLSNWNRIGPDAHGSLTCMRWPGPTDNDTRGPRIAAMLELSDETIATAVLMAGACSPTPFWPKAEITSAAVPTIPIQQPFICTYSFAFVSQPICFLPTRVLGPAADSSHWNAITMPRR